MGSVAGPGAKVIDSREQEPVWPSLMCASPLKFYEKKGGDLIFWCIEEGFPASRDVIYQYD